MKDDYFLDMYAADPDPWGFGSRWYEQRKYALTLAALPRPRYRRVFEPGCSIGILTARLAARADHVDACDIVPAALARTRARVDEQGVGDRVDTFTWSMRDPWPDARYDLVVISEVLYYLDTDDATAFMLQVVEHLDADGHVLVVHWQTPVPDYPLSGAQAQDIASTTPGLSVLATYADDDVTLMVLARPGAPSVATTTGLR